MPPDEEEVRISGPARLLRAVEGLESVEQFGDWGRIAHVVKGDGSRAPV